MRTAMRIMVLGVLPIYFAMQTFEVYLAVRQKLWEERKARIFGIVEPRSETERKTGLKSSISGGFYRYFPNSIAPDFPIGAEPHTSYLGYNEGRGYPVHRTDKYGFFNEDAWWEDHPNVLLVGDSFVDCQQVDKSESLVQQMRDSGHRAISLGVTGSGPYLELAALKTYRPILKAEDSLVVWVYYEGNDLWDAKDECLVPYLRDVVNDDWVHVANIERLQEIRSSHSFGVENKFFRTATLYKTRGAIQEAFGFPKGRTAMKRAMDAAVKYHKRMVVVRIKRLGVSYDRAWRMIDAPVKLEFPSDPKFYGSGITTSHLNRSGYAHLIEMLKPYLP